MLKNIFLDIFVYLAAVNIILRAGIRRNCKALRHRHAGCGHLRKACAFASQNILHHGHVAMKGLTAFAEVVQVLLAHKQYLLNHHGYD